MLGMAVATMVPSMADMNIASRRPLKTSVRWVVRSFTTLDPRKVEPGPPVCPGGRERGPRCTLRTAVDCSLTQRHGDTEKSPGG